MRFCSPSHSLNLPTHDPSFLGCSCDRNEVLLALVVIVFLVLLQFSQHTSTQQITCSTDLTLVNSHPLSSPLTIPLSSSLDSDQILQQTRSVQKMGLRSLFPGWPLRRNQDHNTTNNITDDTTNIGITKPQSPISPKGKQSKGGFLGFRSIVPLFGQHISSDAADTKAVSSPSTFKQRLMYRFQSKKDNVSV